MKLHTMKKREEQVRKMIDEGMIVADMARKLGITPQSVSKFLKVRGWDRDVRKGAPSTREPKSVDPEAAARRAARREARKKMNSSVDRSGAGRHKSKTT